MISRGRDRRSAAIDLERAEIGRINAFTCGFAALCLTVLPAHAAVYVTGRGLDTNPCTLELPCRQIGHALTVVAYGGEIVVSGSGEFLPFTVTSAVSIIAAPGVHAGVISSTPSLGIMIQPGPTDNVLISGLDVTGSSASTGLINFVNGWVTIENCLVHDSVANSGIANLSPNSSTSVGRLYIKNTTIMGGGEGVYIFQNTNPALPTIIEHSTIQMSVSTAVGIYMGSSGTLVVRDSEIVGNPGNPPGDGTGLEMDIPPDSGIGLATVDHCLIANHAIGISGSSFATVEVSNSTIANNARFGINPGGTTGPIVSFGNNAFVGNATDGTFTSTVSLK